MAKPNRKKLHSLPDILTSRELLTLHEMRSLKCLPGIQVQDKLPLSRSQTSVVKELQHVQWKPAI